MNMSGGGGKRARLESQTRSAISLQEISSRGILNIEKLAEVQALQNIEDVLVMEYLLRPTQYRRPCIGLLNIENLQPAQQKDLLNLQNFRKVFYK